MAVLLWRYCCGKGNKGKNEKVDASLPCYPPARIPGDVPRPRGYPGMFPGDVFFRPLFMMLIRMCNHASLFISGVVVPGMVPNVIPDRYVAYISV